MKTRYLLYSVAAASIFFSACEKNTNEGAGATAEQVKVDATATQTAAAKTAAQEPEVDGQWAASAKYGVKFLVPEDWKIKSTDEAIAATSPDDTMTIILVGTESEGVFEAAMGSVTSQLQIKDIKTEKSQMTVVNGLGGFYGSGSAVLATPNGDQEIQFLGYALRLDSDQAVAMMVFSEAEMYEARKEEIESIARSIQKS